jgi:hypothetical protein
MDDMDDPNMTTDQLIERIEDLIEEVHNYVNLLSEYNAKT